MTNIRDILAKNMRAYRNALGLTQAQLAEKVDTSTHYIGMIETKNAYFGLLEHLIRKHLNNMPENQ